MEYKVIVSPPALRDLHEIQNYIATDDSAAAQKFRRKLLDEALGLKRFPGRGGLIKRDPEIRFLVCKAYLVVYRINKDRGIVQILRFWHSARDIKRLRHS